MPQQRPRRNAGPFCIQACDRNPDAANSGAPKGPCRDGSGTQARVARRAVGRWRKATRDARSSALSRSHRFAQQFAAFGRRSRLMAGSGRLPVWQAVAVATDRLPPGLGMLRFGPCAACRGKPQLATHRQGVAYSNGDAVLLRRNVAVRAAIKCLPILRPVRQSRC